MARIRTPEAILSYPNFFTADEKGKYGVSLVFPEGTDLKELKKAALDALQARWGDKMKGAQIVSLETQHGPAYFLKAGAFVARLPWRDQDEAVAAKGYPEGSTFMNVRSNRPPQIVSIYPGPDGRPSLLQNPEVEIYPGVIAKATIEAYCYDTDGNKGVTFGMGNVQKIRDGDRLDGRAAAALEFDADPNAAADLNDVLDTVAATAASPAASDPADDLSDLIGA